MSEQLEIYDMDSNLLQIQDRGEFYDEIKKEFEDTGKISKKVKTVRLILMNSQGRIYLQKRSSTKKENAGLYDKTVGGHVSAGESYDLTIIRECAEELGFPASIINEDEFENASQSTDLTITGIIREIEELDEFLSTRETPKGPFIQPDITMMYVGYYDGALRFVDGESSGIETYSLSELEEELQKNPSRFTKDLIWMIQKYQNLLTPLR